jgi:hypothetical protein
MNKNFDVVVQGVEQTLLVEVILHWSLRKQNAERCLSNRD